MKSATQQCLQRSGEGWAHLNHSVWLAPLTGSPPAEDGVRRILCDAINIIKMIMDKDILTFSDRQAWRAWLLFHSFTVSEAWLVIRKKRSVMPGLSLADAVEEALCFGWIDSTLNTLDDQSYLLRFSPRKPNSVWSMTNIGRVEKLQRNGLMTEAGLAAVEAAQENGQWQAAIEREDTENIPSDLEGALQQLKGGKEAFYTLPTSKRKQYVYWLQSAKREETRQRRIEEIVRLTLAAQ